MTKTSECTTKIHEEKLNSFSLFYIDCSSKPKAIIHTEMSKRQWSDRERVAKQKEKKIKQ